MSRFYYPQKISKHTEVSLSADEAHHALKVLRLETGATIELINGMGAVAQATIIEISKKGLRVQIESVTDYKNEKRVHLVFAMTKGGALDFILHRCTEVGIASFQPVLSQHSVQLKEFNEERWKRVFMEVCKQCQDPFFPTLYKPLKFSEWIQRRQSDRLLIVCDEADRHSKPPMIAPDKEVDVLVGSEGGWSKEERALFSSAYFLGLGKNRLRAETSALTSLVLTKKMVGEL